MIRLSEFFAGGMEGGAFLRCPCFPRIFAHQFEQFFIAAFFAEPDVIGEGNFIKIHKFIIQPVFLIIGLFRNNPGDGTGNAVGVQKLHNADTLVSFLHVKPVHKFIDNDRISDAVVNLMVVKRGPLCRKFGFFRQKGHEITGKGIGPACRFSTYDLG